MRLPAPAGLPPSRDNQLIGSRAWASSTSSCSQPSTSSGRRPAAPRRTRRGSRSAAGRRRCWTRSPGRRSGPRTRARTPSCSAGGPMTSSPPTGRTRRAARTTRSPRSSTAPKYVASRGRPDLSWAGSTQLGPDLPGAVREIRDRHEHVKVVGSLNLVQTLLREKLFDRLDLWVHPIVLGVGKKVFDGGAVPTNVTLLEPPVAGPKGTVYLRYGLADGTPGTGDMTAPDRGARRDD